MNTWSETLESKCRYLQEIQDYRLNPSGYFILHIDGKNFSTLTKKFKRPFDETFMDAMNQTAIEVLKEVSGARVGFVQSDEISIIVSPRSQETGYYIDPWLAGRIWKISSIAASTATLAFNKALGSYDGRFDCKVWSVSSKEDSYAWLSYRSIDCLRNSKQQFSQTFLSHKKLLGKTSDEQISLVLKETGNSWELLDDTMKFGRLIYREPLEVQGPSGNSVMRTRWVVHPGFPMIGSEGYEKFTNLSIL